jgi:hypothetical protein
MLRRVSLVRTDVSVEFSASMIRVTRIGELGTLAVSSNRRCVLQLLVTANVFPTSLIHFTLIMEVTRFYETSVLTRSTRRHIPEDGILQNDCHVCWHYKHFELLLRNAVFIATKLICSLLLMQISQVLNSVWIVRRISSTGQDLSKKHTVAVHPFIHLNGSLISVTANFKVWFAVLFWHHSTESWRCFASLGGSVLVFVLQRSAEDKWAYIAAELSGTYERRHMSGTLRTDKYDEVELSSCPWLRLENEIGNQNTDSLT